MFTQMPNTVEEIHVQQMDPLFIAERLKKWDPDISSGSNTEISSLKFILIDR